MDIRTVSIITDLVLIALLVIYLIGTYKERKRIKNKRKFLTIILFKKRKPSHYRIVDVEGRGVLFVIQGLFGKKWKDVDEDGHSGYKHYFTKLDANDAMNRFVNGIEIGSKDTIYAPFPVNNSGKLKQFPGHRNPPSPPDPQVALKDANEIAGKSAAKDAERIARLEKEVDTLIREKNEQFDRIRELEKQIKEDTKIIKMQASEFIKSLKTPSKNATSGK